MELVSSCLDFQGSKRAGRCWYCVETWHDSWQDSWQDSHHRFSILFCSCFLRTVLMMPSTVGGSMAWAREWPRSRMRMWTLPRRRWASWRSSTTCSSDGGEALLGGPDSRVVLTVLTLYTCLPPQEKTLLLSKLYLLSALSRKTCFTEDKRCLYFRSRRGDFVNRPSLFLIPRPFLSSCLLPPASMAHLTPF